MSSQPHRPEPQTKIDPETQAILDERLKTIDQDQRQAMDAREALAEIRRNLKHPAPR